jgi:Cu2+-exporting ATPase
MATNNNDTIFLPLENVESEHCALIVDKGLSQVKGVESHKVELNNRRAAIIVDDEEAVASAVKAIKDLGYGVTTIKKSFPVLNMTCASCAVSVESMAKNVKGSECCCQFCNGYTFHRIFTQHDQPGYYSKSHSVC